MGTTTPPVFDVAVESIAEDLRATLLRPREEILRHEAPRQPYTAQLVRSVRCGKAHPVHMLLAISMADAEDRRIPIGDVVAFYEHAIAILKERRLEVESRRIPVEAPSLTPVFARELRAQYELDGAQDRVKANPDDPEAIEDALRKSAAYDVAQEAHDHALRERLARLRSTEAREPVAVG